MKDRKKYLISLLSIIMLVLLPLNTVFAVELAEITDDTELKTIKGIVIVSKEHPTPKGFKIDGLGGISNDMIQVTYKDTGNSTGKIFRGDKTAIDHLKKLLKEANSNSEHKKMFIVSGYRSYDEQKAIKDADPDNELKSTPGYSEHHTGLAFDVTTKEFPGLDEAFGDTVEGKWLKDNVHDYGFIIRYEKGKEDITGYTYEPWHIRFIGVEKAKEYGEKGCTTLEDYVNDTCSGEDGDSEGGEDGEEGDGRPSEFTTGADFFDPFKSDLEEVSKIGVDDGSLKVPDTVSYGTQLIIQKVYYYSLVISQIILAFAIVLVSLQAFMLGVRLRDGDFTNKTLQKIGNLITGNIQHDQLVKRIFINMGVLMLAFTFIFGQWHFYLFKVFYEFLLAFIGSI